MEKAQSLEDLVRSKLVLGRRSATGFETIICAPCNDYKSRGGFKFEGGDNFYSCFNCGLRVKQDDTERLTSKMREVLLAFGFTQEELTRHDALKFFGMLGEKKATGQVAKIVNQVELPPGSYKLSEATGDEWADVAWAYLGSRGLPADSYEWYLSSDAKYRTRIILPFLRQGSLIYYQARSMDGSQPKYLNPSVDKGTIFFNEDELRRHTSDHLFVCEGAFNAMSIGPAVALAGSTLSKYHIDCLKKVTSREVVFTIDIDEHALNGYHLGEAALRHGWGITWLTGFNDANDAMISKGKLWMLSELTTNIRHGLEAQVQLNMLFARQLQEEKKKKNDQRRKAKATVKLSS